MAASTAFTVAGSATSIEFSTLSSKSAFGSSCNVVQGAPMARSAARVGAIRASSNNSEEARPARREVLAGLLAAGAALGFSNQASAGTPVDDAQNLVDEAGAGIKRRIDGLFGKNKPYPQRNTQVTGNGPIADAKNRVNNFLDKSQNPLATNLDKATKEAASGLDTATGPNSASARAGKEFLGQDSTRVDEATARVNAGAEKLQGKAVQAFDDAKGAAQSAVGAAKDVAPDAPNVSAPNPSGLFNALGSKLEGVKGDVASKAEDAKSMLPGQ
ncbi:hypothetical protein KC19_2G022300 [Ceratodon purpureus]|uniref:Uncharacterized protein n=1 Tax=Ceratodon purpureus TaxID=3225 RepID=A0A8T0ISD0_CERPU|nr:hypothetical protein KC19_2G022300 [Ceratodon purpureus]